MAAASARLAPVRCSLTAHRSCATASSRRFRGRERSTDAPRCNISNTPRAGAQSNDGCEPVRTAVCAQRRNLRPLRGSPFTDGIDEEDGSSKPPVSGNSSRAASRSFSTGNIRATDMSSWSSISRPSAYLRRSRTASNGSATFERQSRARRPPFPRSLGGPQLALCCERRRLR